MTGLDLLHAWSCSTKRVFWFQVNTCGCFDLDSWIVNCCSEAFTLWIVPRSSMVRSGSLAEAVNPTRPEASNEAEAILLKQTLVFIFISLSLWALVPEEQLLKVLKRLACRLMRVPDSEYFRFGSRRGDHALTTL